MTFSLNNFPRTDPRFNVAMQWEKEFLKIVQEYQKDPTNNFTFAYMAEVCNIEFIQNKILYGYVLNLSTVVFPQRSLEDEINRTTAEDIPIFMISYAVIFVYIAVALGEYSSCKRLLVRL